MNHRRTKQIPDKGIRSPRSVKDRYESSGRPGRIPE